MSTTRQIQKGGNMNTINKAIKEIETIIIQNQQWDWNDERVGGLQIALDVLYKLEGESTEKLLFD